MAEEMKMAPQGSIEAKDPFAAVPAGYSLTIDNERWPWGQPPQKVDPSEVLEDAIDSLTKCLENLENIEKASFVQAGLKVKKTMGAQWTDEAQSLFKQVLSKL